MIQNTITYALVIAAFLLIQILMAGGHINSLLKGILVPLCTYVILAVSLNLTVGILGELSLGHAGFMCVGAFSGAFFTHVTGEGSDGLFLVHCVLSSLKTVKPRDFSHKSLFYVYIIR